MKDKFIVAEITKSWTRGMSAEGQVLLSSRFEEVINVNLERGYILKDWKLTSSLSENLLTETIIAIFELNLI